MNIFAPCVALLSASLATAQTCDLAADINPTVIGQSSSPQADGPLLFAPLPATRGMTKVGGSWFFSAWTVDHGRELYRTDGTTAGTSLVLDINPGSPDSTPRDIVELGGIAYFQAQTDTTGSELWRSDGTAAGTYMVKDIDGQVTSSIQSSLKVLGNRLIFGATDAGNGGELWTSDGTAAGTQMLADIMPGSGSSFPIRLTLDHTGTSMLFHALDPTLGSSIWKTDGTLLGTSLVKDLDPSSTLNALAIWSPMRSFATRTYFIAISPNQGAELWSTDGTTAGTGLVKDINPGPAGSEANLAHAVELNGEVYFRARNGTNGLELWKTDGTTAGTVQVPDVALGALGSRPVDMTIMGGELFFVASDNGSTGRELWKLDPVGNPSLVADLVPGPAASMLDIRNVLIENGGQLYFRALAPDSGLRELYTTDGTTAGTSVLRQQPGPGSESFHSPDYLTPLGPNSLMFTASSLMRGIELWQTSGTPATTLALADMNPKFTPHGSGVTVADRAQSGNRFYTWADDGVHGTELHVWNPGSGLTMLKDINPDTSPSASAPGLSAWLGDHELFFFTEFTPLLGREIWTTDGTEAGTHILKDIAPGPAFSFPTLLFADNERVYFSAQANPQAGTQLWITDGTAAGTTVLADINPGPAYCDAQDFVNAAGKIFFTAKTANEGSELWITDGTTAGTKMVMDIHPGFGGSAPNGKLAVGDRVVFSAWDGVSGYELWISDGALGGTQMIKDISPGSLGSKPLDMTLHQGMVYFSATDGVNGVELWKSDLQTAGTTMVTNIMPGAASSDPIRLMSADNGLFFAATAAFSQRELWLSDGTAAGTALVKDINPVGDGDPYDITPASGGVYFAASDGINGNELYFSDGTLNGTGMVCDLTPGASSSHPQDLTLSGGDLFFVANSKTYGRELFKLAQVGAYVNDFGISGSHSILASTTPRLGQTLAVSGSHAPAGSFSLLAMSPGVDHPSSFLTSFGSAAWVDPATASALFFYGTSSFGISQALPTTPSLVGATINLQTWHLPGGSFPASTSNGLQLVFGL